MGAPLFPQEGGGWTAHGHPGSAGFSVSGRRGWRPGPDQATRPHWLPGAQDRPDDT